MTKKQIAARSKKYRMELLRLYRGTKMLPGIPVAEIAKNENVSHQYVSKCIRRAISEGLK